MLLLYILTTNITTKCQVIYSNNKITLLYVYILFFPEASTAQKTKSIEIYSYTNVILLLIDSQIDR